MKKNYLYLAAASLLMAGCAQDSFVDDNLQETTVPQEIKMSAGNRGISVEGRGVGSIGTGTDETTWNNEEIHVYAFNKNLTSFANTDESNVYLNDAKAIVAANNSVQFVNTTGTNITEYYPLQGAFRFVGFHTDNATLGIPTASATDIKIPVKIDGSHDIMIAKAELSKEDKEKIFNAMKTKGVFGNTGNNELVDTNYNPVDGAFKTTIENEYEKAYSSYTARRNVQPNLVFTHELVRLNFYVKAGDDKTFTKTENITDSDGTVTSTKKIGVYIKNIIVNSHKEGQILINKDGNISFNDVSTAEEELSVGSKETTSGEITTLAETGNDETDYTNSKATKVGEGILVMLPTKEFTNADNSINKYYTATIETQQYVDQNGTDIAADKQTRKYENVKIQKPQITENGQSVTKEFEAGKSYDITITVYSNQAINVTATLTGWVDGGSIEINPEDEYFDSSTN